MLQMYILYSTSILFIIITLKGMYRYFTSHLIGVRSANSTMFTLRGIKESNDKFTSYGGLLYFLITSEELFLVS